MVQGFGLLVLCRILFGGFGGGGGGGNRIEKRISPEEKERFRQRMRDRICRTPADGQPSTNAE